MRSEYECGQCNKKYFTKKEDQNFCWECGGLIVENPRYTEKICVNCEEENPVDAKFCGCCGRSPDKKRK